MLDGDLPDARFSGRSTALGDISDTARVAFVSTIYHIHMVHAEKKSCLTVSVSEGIKMITLATKFKWNATLLTVAFEMLGGPAR
jgi:hypothetical protein